MDVFGKLKDPFSGLSHLFGTFLAIAGLSVLVTLAAQKGTPWQVVSFAVYGASLVLLYTASSLYHLLPLSERGEKIFRTLDHTMIYMLIAGTYTPLCLVPLRGGWGWSIFGVVWGLAFAGIFLSLFWLAAPRWLSTAIYLLMGWVCIVAIYPIVTLLTTEGLFWLVSGGLFYTIGAVIYALKKPNPWPEKFGFHEIWHLFVLAGSACHFMLMFRYVLNA
ncbi:MAG TPA: hemolysin III family protein [Desulfobulbus sp.]|nr:hemolysin III family protein [Desulfobulbus sp.]